MRINRNKYLETLIRKKDNGMTKVITGIRRSGKSYMLFHIYADYLKSIGVKEDHIITLALDLDKNFVYRNPIKLGKYIRSLLKDSDMYYVFLDEIQKVSTIENPYAKGDMISFVDVALGLMQEKNVDLYITGSNSKMLATDIITEFRGRGDQIHIRPLSYEEFYNAYDGNKNNAFNDYLMYGGLPYVMSLKTHEDKANYLNNLFDEVYTDDILECHDIKSDKVILEDLLDLVSSSISSLTNPLKISNTFKSQKKYPISINTISRYLDYFVDSFLIEKVKRYDIKGRHYIESLNKYYFTDLGLRNARLNFREMDEPHLMENIIYNELITRGFSVDIGIIEHNFKDKNDKSKRVQLEIDFVINKASQRIYIQSAYSIYDNNEKEQETRGFKKIADSFKKIVIVRNPIIPYYDNDGVLFVSLEDFLLKKEFTDF